MCYCEEFMGLKNENEKLKNSNGVLRELLKKKDEVIKRLHNENEERVYIRQSLEARIEELKKENKELKTPNFSDTCKDNAIKHLATENATLKSVANTQRDRIKELSDENKTIRNVNKTLKSVLGDQRGKIQELTDINEKCRADNVDIMIDVANVLAILDHMTDTMANTADAFKNAASTLTRENEETEDDD